MIEGTTQNVTPLTAVDLQEEATGIVKWFNNVKGYGFICSETSDVEIFAHYSQIQADGYKTLKPGQVVTFNLAPSDRGFHAHNIKSIEQSYEGLNHSCSNIAM